MSTVAVLGASNNPERFSNKAVKLLLAHGHEVFPVNPGIDQIEGLRVSKKLSEIATPVDTLSLYIGPKNIGPLIPQIVDLQPKRVILNPGTESEELKKALQNAGISYVEDCTLVMLRSGRF